MKKFSFITFISFLSAALFFAASCTIGLGSSVDTEAPQVAFTSPESGAVIRDKFGIFGTWTDDGKIKSVTAHFQSLAFGSDSVKDYTADLEVQPGTSDGTKGIWALEIDPFNDSNPLLDGTYEVTITIEDNGGHSSKITRQYVIDNTPPVIVLQRPGTDSSVDLTSADSYGQNFTLEGMGADDNNIDHINVNIYSDADRINLVHTVTLNNVPPTIQLDVAKFGEPDYTSIYGSTEKEGAKQFYCSIEAYDNAQRYPVDGSNQSAADTKGNCTTNYYLYDSISTSVLSAYKITDVYHMLSGVYTSSSERSSADIISSVRAALAGKVQTVGSFSLNPTNNPTFVVNGKDTLKTVNLNLSTDENYAITNNSDVIVEVSPGLDVSPLVNEDIFRVYVIECSNDGKVLPTATKIYPTQNSKTKSGSNYKFSVNLSNTCGLTVGKNYIFGVDGKDEAGNTIMAANNGYGFYLAASGNAPELKVEEPSGSMMYVSKNGNFAIKGYAIVDAGTPTVKILNGEEEWKVLTFDESEKDKSFKGEKNKFNFNIVFDNAFIQSKSNYKADGSAASTEFTLTVQASQNGNNSFAYKTIMYDVDGPVININNDGKVSPAVENYANAAGKGKNTGNLYYSNGQISVTGNIVDDFTSVTEYSWSINQDNIAIPGIGGTVKKSSKINISFDSTKLADQKATTVVLKAIDAAGNETIENLSFFLDQSTDRPVAAALDGTSWKSGIYNTEYIQLHLNDAKRTNIIATGNNLLASVTDDDGLAKVDVKVEAVNSTGLGPEQYEQSAVTYTKNDTATEVLSPDIKSKTYDKSGLEASVSHQMPSTAGFYLVTLTVYDIYYDANKSAEVNAKHFTTESFIIKISGTAPEVTVSRPSKYVKTDGAANAKVKVELTILGEPEYTVVRKLYRNDDYVPEPVVTNQSSTEADRLTAIITDEFLIKNHDFSKSVIYSVIDKSGSEAIKEVTYFVDNTAPSTISITSPVNDTSATKDNAFKGTDISFRGEARDDASGMSKLYYAFTSNTASEPADNEYSTQTVGDGVWNINVNIVSSGEDNKTKLKEGKYKLWVKAEDAAGNKTAAKSRIFYIDQAAPVISDVKLNNLIVLTKGKVDYFKTDSGDFTITGKITESHGIKSLSVAGENVTVNSDGTWTKTISRSTDTDIKIDITVVDDAERETKETYTIFCDTTAPTGGISAPESNLNGEKSLSGSSYTFRGNADDSGGAGIKVMKYLIVHDNEKVTDIVASATASDAATKGWVTPSSVTSFTDAKTLVTGTAHNANGYLHEGKWYIYFYIEDNVGNKTTDEREFWIDQAIPVISLDDISTPTNSAVTLKATSLSDANGIAKITVNVDGTDTVYTANSTKTVDAFKNEITGAGVTYSVTSAQVQNPDLADGSHTIKVTVEDTAGKQNSAEKTFVVDTTKPKSTESKITTVAGDGGWYATKALAVSSKLIENGSGIKSVEAVAYKVSDTEHNTKIAETSLYLNGQAYIGNLSFISAEDGEYTIIIKATDNANNVNDITIANANIDTTAPSLSEVKLGSDTLTDGSVKYYTSTAAKVTITGKVTEALSGYQQFYVKAGDAAPEYADVSSWTASSTPKDWSIEVPTTQNENVTITVYAEDKAGNKDTKKYIIHNDTEAPTVEISAPDTDAYGENSLNGTKYTFAAGGSDTGTGIASMKYLFTQTEIKDGADADSTNVNEIIASATAADASSKGWVTKTTSSFNIKKNFIKNNETPGTDDLTEGKWYFYVYAEDKSGNKGVDQRYFWIDTSDPELSINEIATPTNKNIVIKGTASDANGLKSIKFKLDSNAEVEYKSTEYTDASKTKTKLDDFLEKLQAGITYTNDLKKTAGVTKLADGEHKFTITAIDNAERETEVVKTILIDTKNPTGTVTLPDPTGAVTLPGETDPVDYDAYKTETIKVKVSGIADKADDTTNGSGIDTVEAVILPEISLASDPQLEALSKRGTGADAYYEGNLQIAGQGINVVKVVLTDKAGNTNEIAKTVFVDTYAPDTFEVYEDNNGTPSATKLSGTKLINGKSSFVIYIKTSDYDGADGTVANSGLSTITYNYEEGTLIPGDPDSNGFRKLTIPANVTGKTYQATGSAKFTVKDNAGNSATYTPFTFDIDDDPPQVKISDIVDADNSPTEIDVNGILTISGTASDNNKISRVELKYYVGSTAPTAAQWTAGKVSSDGDIQAAAVTGTTSWSATIDTTSLSDNTNLYLKAIATDSSENVGYSSGSGADTVVAEKTLHINQDSDRPVISFSNIDLSQPANVWLTGGRIISGIITDDDGSIATGTVDSTTKLPTGGFCYKDLRAETPVWTPITVLNGGAWKISESDGPHELIFYVKDAGKAFQTDLSDTITAELNLNQPKLKSEDESNTYWIAEKKDNPEDNENAKVTLKIDTKAPTPSGVKYTNKAFASATNDSDWKSDQTELLFGGNYKQFSLKLNVQDDNGIKKVTGVFNGETLTAEIVKQKVNGSLESESDAKLSPVAHEWVFKDIAIPTSETFTGNKDFVIKLWDYSNADNEPGKEETVSITVDNVPPQISFSNYKDDDSVFATSAINIRGTETAGNLADWYYLITNSTETQSKTSITKSLKLGDNAGASFSVVFDKVGMGTTEVLDKSLFDYIQSLESITEEALKADDTVRTLYMWVWGKDRAGNESDPISLRLNVIPNGDKPSVAFSYPSAPASRLGGIVRLTGSARTQTDSVESVYIQIDPTPTVTRDGEGKVTKVEFTNAWESHLLTAIQKAYGSKDAQGNVTPNTSKKIKDVYSNFVEDTGKTGEFLKAIKASGTTDSWNLALNESDELNDSQIIAVRVFAISTSKKKVSQVVTTWFTMDPDAPQIGSRMPLELVQFQEGKEGNFEKDANGKYKYITNRQNYESDMWINGQWYLIGSVDDDGGIQKLNYKKNDEAPVLIVEKKEPIENTIDNYVGKVTSDTTYSNYVIPVEIDEKDILNNDAGKTPYKVDGVAQKDKVYNFNLCIPVGVSANDGGFGELTYRIVATEGSSTGLTAQQDIKLKYDNEAPRFALTSGEVENKKTADEKLALDVGSTVQDIINSSGNYTLYGAFDEASNDTASQSGFRRIAFYFTRDITTGSGDDAVTTTYLIDPMLTPDDSNNDGRANFFATSNFETYKSVSAKGDGLYWKRLTGKVSNSSSITFTTAIPEYVRKAGLVKINGVIYLIKSVDYTNKTVVIQGTLQNDTESSTTDLYFALAQVVDHLQNESGVTTLYDKNNDLEDKQHDDGDQMIEGVSSSGTTYTWKASIDASLVLDGGVKMHFVAFDAAGNATEKIYEGNVKNNAPRLYGVKYGTDQNSDNDVTGTEWVTTYSQCYSVLSAGGDTDETDDDEYMYGYEKVGANILEKTEISIPVSDRITLKGVTKVVPQIVGGNVGLGYSMKYKKNPATSDVTTSTVTLYDGVGHSNDGTERTDDLTITLETKDFLAAPIGPIGDGNQTLEFQIWDKTDGKTPGAAQNGSYYATIKLPVKVTIQDTEVPTVKIKPFHWRSASDNSLYNNSSKNGHIELENDLPSKTFRRIGTGVYDLDPKVSGVITLEGEVWDNVRVDEIVVNIPGYAGAKPTIKRSGTTWVTVPAANKVTDTSSALSTDWAFQLAAKDDTYAADGSNTVKFKLHFNTAKITGVAAKDVLVTVVAKDKGCATYASATKQVSYVPNESGADITEATYGAVKNDGKTYYLDSACTQVILSNSDLVYTAASGTYGSLKASGKELYIDSTLTNRVKTLSQTISDDTTVYVFESKTMAEAKSDTTTTWYKDAGLGEVVVLTEENINVADDGYVYAWGNNKTFGEARNQNLDNVIYYTDSAKTYRAMPTGSTVWQYRNWNWTEVTNTNNTGGGREYYIEKDTSSQKVRIIDDSVKVYGIERYTYAEAKAAGITPIYTSYTAPATIGTTEAIGADMVTLDTATVYGLVARTYSSIKTQDVAYYIDNNLNSESTIGDGTTVYYLQESTYAQAKADTTHTYYLNQDLTGDIPAAPADGTKVYRFAQTASGAESQFYRMDIVPYISGVKTALSKKSKKVDSVYNRSALGRYPVASTETEITLTGFNLTTTTISAADLTTGYYSTSVNNIPLLNNINNNNAVGQSGANYTDNDYAYCYNRQPNGLTNEQLTDDIYFDVWEFRKAAASKMGKLKEPVMHINPANGMIGFAFANGSDRVSLPTSALSYTNWQKNYADYSGIAFEYDSNGNAHSVSIGLDTEPNSGYAGRMQYILSLFGGNGDNLYNWNTNRTVSLESVGIPSGVYVEGTALNANLVDPERFGTPAIAVSKITDSRLPTVYIAYFDSDNNQIRFRYGTITAQDRTANPIPQFGQLNDSKAGAGSIQNDTTAAGSSYNTHAMFEAHSDYYSLLAGKMWDQTKATTTPTVDTGNGASEFVALDVVSGANEAEDVVVVVWYDGSDLKYTYRYGQKDDTDCNANGVEAVTSGNNKHGGWSKPETIFSGLGEYCKIKVDDLGGVHIAAYDSEGEDLYYAYMSSYSDYANLKTAVVDSYAQVGKHISIDTAKIERPGVSGQYNVVPYITYYGEGYSGLPKVAFLPNGINKDNPIVPNGSNIDTDEFTAEWEVEVIPTTSDVREDNMNIGLWKNASGVLTASNVPENHTNATITTGTMSTTCYGNGTSKVVLGYAIMDSVNGFIETAQLK